MLKDYKQDITVDENEIKNNKITIVETLKNYNIEIVKITANVGPTVTMYEIKPAAGIKINKIKSLENDIAMSLAALGIRIIAPIPGKDTIGIEVPNKNAQIVGMKSLIASEKFQKMEGELPVVLGKTIQNEIFVFDLADMPHLLVAGATGQGKSVGLNVILASLLYKKHPTQLKFVLIDPKQVEFSLYNDLKNHFLATIDENLEDYIITDTDNAKLALLSLVTEMEDRYRLLKKARVRNIKEYNSKFFNRELNPQNGHRFLPYIVIVIDEFADLIMMAGKEIEIPISRIAQKARAVGMHMIIATQRPSTNVITGLIKANFPARIAFRVTSNVDSRTILDHPGAEKLIGRGDLLFSKGSGFIRLQCGFLDTSEVENIVTFIHQQQGLMPLVLPEPETEEGEKKDVSLDKLDPLFEEVAYYVVESQSGSTSMIQRKFSVGFNRAGKIMDQLEAAKIVGPAINGKPRKVLVNDTMTLEQILETLK
jgi:S-DNA-T family DNA segregation ATPase FtsK/SpoIIIE